MNESYEIEPHKRPKMNGREVPFNPKTGEGIAFPTGGKPIPQYEIEERFNELPPAPGKPTYPKPPKFTRFAGKPVKRDRWDDRFWDQFGKAADNPLIRWGFNTKGLKYNEQTDSALENLAELYPNPYTAIALGADDIVNAESDDKKAFEIASMASPLTRSAFPAASLGVQGLDFIDDMVSDSGGHSKEGRHDTFWPWDMYEADVARRKAKKGF